jgi:5,6-dimethylbenzimidazole synthase
MTFGRCCKFDQIEFPQEWKLVAYLCVGYPVEDSDAPEFERAGWESRDFRAITI